MATIRSSSAFGTYVLLFAHREDDNASFPATVGFPPDAEAITWLRKQLEIAEWIEAESGTVQCRSISAEDANLRLE